jgi:hypothetical protein
MLTLGALMWTAPGRAQSQTCPPDQNSYANRQDVAEFDHFLDSHSGLAEKLRSDPSLANDQEFIEDNSDLQSFLQQHPGIWAELQQNAGVVIERYDRHRAQGSQ